MRCNPTETGTGWSSRQSFLPLQTKKRAASPTCRDTRSGTTHHLSKRVAALVHKDTMRHSRMFARWFCESTSFVSGETPVSRYIQFLLFTQVLNFPRMPPVEFCNNILLHRAKRNRKTLFFLPSCSKYLTKRQYGCFYLSTTTVHSSLFYVAWLVKLCCRAILWHRNGFQQFMVDCGCFEAD